MDMFDKVERARQKCSPGEQRVVEAALVLCDALEAIKGRQERLSLTVWATAEIVRVLAPEFAAEANVILARLQ